MVPAAAGAGAAVEEAEGAGAAGGALARRDGMGDPKSGANPYLEELSPAPQPIPDIPAFSPLSIPDLSAGAALPEGAAAKALDGSKAAFPDFAQPADDDKYFRQMKRF